MAELLLGAALGAAFSVLCDAVDKVTVGKFNKFSPLLGSLRSTLNCIEPLVIKQIGEYNEELNLPNDEIQKLQKQMEEGEKLVRKLSKLAWWNRIKPSYVNQLVALDASLKGLLKHVLMQQARDVKENLLVARQTAQQLVEFQELSERLLEERTLLQEGAKDLQKEFVSALANNGMQLVQLQTVIEQMMKPQNGGEVTPTGTGNSEEDQLKTELELFILLYERFQQLNKKNIIHKPVLASIDCTLNSMKPFKESLRPANHRQRELQRPLRRQMETGLELFRECSHLHTWNTYRKFKYAHKLIQWEESLQREINIWKELQREFDLRSFDLPVAKVRSGIIAKSDPAPRPKYSYDVSP